MFLLVATGASSICPQYFDPVVPSNTMSEWKQIPLSTDQANKYLPLDIGAQLAANCNLPIQASTDTRFKHGQDTNNKIKYYQTHVVSRKKVSESKPPPHRYFEHYDSITSNQQAQANALSPAHKNMLQGLTTFDIKQSNSKVNTDELYARMANKSVASEYSITRDLQYQNPCFNEIGRLMNQDRPRNTLLHNVVPVLSSLGWAYVLVLCLCLVLFV